MKSIIVSEELGKALKIYDDHVKECQEAIRLAGQSAKGYREQFWKLLYDEYPNLKEGEPATYDVETKELLFQEKTEINL